MSISMDKLFIFEMANNHQSDVSHGIQIIQEMGKIARKYHLNAAIKFQYRQLDTFIHPDFRDDPNIQHIPRFLSTRLEMKQFKEMVDAVKHEGLMPISTPFDEASVDVCIQHELALIKVASCSADDWPLLEKIAQTKKKVIVSTAGLTIHQIDNLVSFLQHHHVDFGLMHCVALYPTESKQCNMSFLKRMLTRYPGISIGYSGHESPDNLEPIAIALGLGAKMYERHVGLPTESIQLNKYSMSPPQVEAWVKTVLNAHAIMGNDQREYNEIEQQSLLSLKRGVYLQTAKRKGEQITAKDVFFAMPCQTGQLSSGEFGRFYSELIASQDYDLNSPLTENIKELSKNQINQIILDAKGMIYEARIAMGFDFTIELSHHYGLEDFHRVGALIVNFINREYCKKLVVVLPNQRHPNHYHKRKEETFHILWGTIIIIINGEEKILHAGEKVLIERGDWHSFRSDTGGIIEEISTTHYPDDSYYEDHNIVKKDLAERKTSIDSW